MREIAKVTAVVFGLLCLFFALCSGVPLLGVVIAHLLFGESYTAVLICGTLGMLLGVSIWIAFWWKFLDYVES